MAEIAQLGSAEGRFCGVLAAAIARQVTASDHGPGPGRKGAVFFHYFESSLELASEVLTKLGLLAPDPRGTEADGGGHRPNVLTMDVERMPNFVGQAVGPGDARIAETVASFVNIACYYGGLSDERAPFAPPAAFAEALRWLARFGYAECVGDRYGWTDRIGPAMRACYLWDAALRSNTTLERDRGLAEAEVAWRTMPDTIRRRFFSGQPMVFSEFVKVLAQHWRGGEWRPASDAGSLRADRILACRIIEIAEGRRADAR